MHLFPKRSHGLLSCGVLLALSSSASAANARWDSWEAFDVTAGVGAIMRPTYLGSDRYKASPMPLIDVKWNDTVALGAEGLRLYWHADRLTIGAGLTFDPGRDEKDSGTFAFGAGDDRLKGLGKIDAALGYQIFASYRLWRINLHAAAIKFDGKQNDGVVVRYGAALPLPLGDSFVVTPHIDSQWGNKSYTQTYFGVTAQQALRSQFTPFDAGSGTLGVTAGVNLRYALSRHWFVMGDVSTTALTGDAKHSPLSYSNTATTALTMVGYHF
jgi:outer membrane scaffolding protein for murein synthesis (MipA/OmpV family)